MAFHAGHLRGGFLGVDLFFVLSGFLITSLLLAEWDASGSIDLPAFWGRRFRRLLPALLVVLAVVTAYGAVALPATELGELRRSGLGTLGYVANWVAIRSGSDYWAAFSAPSLLQHAWSLAIEEQFYVVWPLLGALGLRLTRGRRGPLVLATSVLAVASVASLWINHRPGASTARAYYGTDTRAAAILYGALAALWLAGRARRSAQPAERVLAWAGVPAALVLVWAWTSLGGTDDALYGFGLPLVGVSAAVLIATVSGPSAGAIGRVLSIRPLGALGRVSYGLYLWHWPVFVVLEPGRFGLHGWVLTTVRVVVSLLLAVLSLRLVEQPVRSGRVPHRRWRVAAPALVGVMGVGILAGTAGAVDRHDDVGDRVSVAPDPAAPQGARSLLVLGDSQAVVLALASPKQVAGMSVGGDATVGCGIGPGLATSHGRPLASDDINETCLGVVDEWAARVRHDDPDVVLLHVGAWDVLDREIGDRVVAFGTPEWDDLTEANLRSVLERLGSQGAQVVALTSPCFAPTDQVEGGDQRGEPARVTRWNELLRRAADATGATVVDYGGFLCPGGAYQEVRDGVPLRSDGVHLTQEGTQMAWRWLDGELRRVLAAS
jgi:peptidoglycan/LPS O-acetylase OafA/YrhL